MKPEDIEAISETVTEQYGTTLREIKTELGEHDTDIQTLNTALAQEKTDRQTSASALTQSINTEKTARQNADNTINQSISALDQRVTEIEEAGAMAFDGGYVDENNLLHLTKEDVDIQDFEPIQLPESSQGLAFDSGYILEESGTYYLHLTLNDQDIEGFTPFALPAGGGGGGGSAIALSEVVRPTTIRNGADALFSFKATSSDDSDIVVHWFVDGTEIDATAGDSGINRSSGISGTTFTFNAKKYLKASSTSVVRAVISCESGGTLTRNWEVTSVPFGVSWSEAVSPVMLYTENENIYVVVNVAAQSRSTNNIVIGTGSNSKSVSVTGSRAVTIELDKSWFTSGANTVRAYLQATDESAETSDEITFVAIWGYGATGPIVAFAEETVEAVQYDTTNIYYGAYTPGSETTACTIQIGSGEPRGVTVGRTMQTLSYVSTEVKTETITLTSGTASDTVTVTVSRNPYNIGIITGDNLRYNLDPTGHSNSDDDREEFGGMTFSEGFDWSNGGFQTDSDGAPAFVVKKGHRVTLPRSLFEDSDTNGKTIDISFKARNSDQYDAVAMQELNNGGTKGIVLRANQGELMLNNATGQIFRYCEENRIDLSIHVEGVGAQRLALIWLDGIPSKANKYEANTLVQDEGRLVIGSDHCDVWVYAIRCYNSALSELDMIQNYIASGATTNDKITRSIANSIFGENSRITPASLHAAAPDLTIINISAERMSVSKKDSVPADITIRDGDTILVLSSADGTIFKVQGTSSVAYGRSALNMDIDFKKTGLKYSLSENAIPVNYLNIKVNVASSENANNVCAVDWYNQFQPYLTEHRSESGARDTVEGKPCAIFFTNTGSEAVWVSSQYVEPGETILYVMGDLCNSKKNTEVFGQKGKGTHPTKACIEVSGNDTRPQRFLETVEYNAERGEWCTFEGYDDQGKEKWTTHYEWRMEPSAEDLDEVVASWNALVAWVVAAKDNPTKFKAEFGNYFAQDSMLFHYLGLEFFAAYDNVSKNTFYSYDWDEAAGKYLWNIKCAYDWDTIIAYDNDGNPLGDYGIDYGDTISGRPYFNAADNPIWLGIKSQFYNELSALYIELRSAGAWDSAGIIAKFDTYQSKRPHASMVRDAYIKYIYPYKTTGVVIDGTTYGYDDNYLSRMNGSKTYQRRQFFTYQTDYMDGKYGYANKSSGTQFRTNGASTTKDFAIKAYAKTYITMMADNNVVASQKVEAGSETIFEGVSVGSNTTLYVTPDRLVQYIRPLNETYNSTFSAAGAAKLMEAVLGGETPNTAWPATNGVNVPSAILHELSIRNMTNFSDSLNLTSNVELESLDTRGTNTGRVTLAPYAPIKTLRLNAVTGLVMKHITEIQTFEIASGENLVTVVAENCDSTIMNALPAYLAQAFNSGSTATRSMRLMGVNWALDDTTILNNLLKCKAIDADGNEGSTPCVLTGSVSVPRIKRMELDAFNAAWGDELTISYGEIIEQYPIRFFDWDADFATDDPLYTIYIDAGGYAYDPVEAGEQEAPTRPQTEQYVYIFSGWSGLPSGAVYNSANVRATYTSEERTYTVTWWDGIGTANQGKGNVIETRTGCAYGTCQVPTQKLPKYTGSEGIGVYYLFDRWSSSTGFIRANVDCVAKWHIGNLPDVSTNTLTLGNPNEEGHFGWAQLRAIAANKRCDDFFEPKEHLDFKLGHDFNFDNVDSIELVSDDAPQFFDASNPAPVIYNGLDGKESIRLFDGSIPRWTLAVDYEFIGDSGVMIGCGTSGIQLTRSSNLVIVNFGSASTSVGYQYQRGIVVIRYNGDYPRVSIVAYDGAAFNATKGTSANTYVINTTTPENNEQYEQVVRSQSYDGDAPLTLGGVGNADGTYTTALCASGWIHWAKLWKDDLGEENIKDLALFPHFEQRFNYTGILLQDDIESTDTVAGGFLSEGALYLVGQMNNVNTNVGGFQDAPRRQWLNGQYFESLPYPLQSLIDSAEVKSTRGGGSSSSPAYDLTTLTEPDNIYLAAYAELFNLTGTDAASVAYRNERGYVADHQEVPYFTVDTERGMTTANQSRIKWPGVILPDDANYIVSSSDPTTAGVTGYTIESGKTVWINTANSSNGFIFVDKEFCERHKYLGGRLISSSENLNPDANNPLYAGGKWIRAFYWWARSPFVTFSTYFWYVYTYGGASYISAYYSLGLVPAFSI